MQKLTASIENQQGQILSDKLKQQQYTINPFTPIINQTHIPTQKNNILQNNNNKTQPIHTIKIIQTTQQNPTHELTINNIPYHKDEQLNKIITDIITQKKLNPQNIKFKAFRALSKTKNHESKTPPLIIITFETTTMKDTFKKRTDTTLTLKDITHNNKNKYTEQQNNETIYINENLPKETRTLLYKTRQLKKDHNFKYVWTTNGIIQLRKNKTTKTYTITNEEQLNEIKQEQDKP